MCSQEVGSEPESELFGGGLDACYPKQRFRVSKGYASNAVGWAMSKRFMIMASVHGLQRE
jgi:hypothetical protein